MTEAEKIRIALIRIAEITRAYGLGNYTIRLDKTRRRVACYYHSRKLFSYSRYFIIASTEDQLVDTVLHEIAHALVVPGSGHNKVWSDTYKRIGGGKNGSKALNNIDMSIERYKLFCPGCNSEYYVNRNIYKRCGKCMKNGDEFYFVVTENKIKVVAW